MLDESDAVHRQQLRKAIEATEWGYSRPRRWSAHYGGIALARGEHAAELNAEYRQHRKRIAALVPVITVSPEWR